MKNLDRIRKQLTPARQRKIAARAATLIVEERSLQELRQARNLTQKRMAHVLGIDHDSVSRLEQRSDLLISTLRGYVEALGGRPSLVAEFSKAGGAVPASAFRRPISGVDGERKAQRLRALGQSPEGVTGQVRETLWHTAIPPVAGSIDLDWSDDALADLDRIRDRRAGVIS